MEAFISTQKTRIKVDIAVEVAAVINSGLSVGFGQDGLTLLLTPTEGPQQIRPMSWQTALGRLCLGLQFAWQTTDELGRIRFLESIAAATPQGNTTSGPCYLVYPRIP